MFELHSGLVYWTVINFVVLLVVLKLFAWRPILDALSSREKGIRESLEQAEAARDESARTKKECLGILAQSRREAAALLDEARQRAEKEQATIMQQARDDAATLLDRARQDIQRERDQALDSLRVEVATLSVLVAGKMIDRTLDLEGHQQIINEALDQFRQHA